MSYGRQNSRGNNGNGGYVPIYTDGACSRNGQSGAQAGVGVYFGPGHPLNVSEPVYGRQTNNTAEIQAVTRGITQARDNGITRVEVRTDSKFTTDCATKWMDKWEQNGWKTSSGGDVKNREDLVRLGDAMQGMDVQFRHVPGHAGVEGNEAANRLAQEGAAGRRGGRY